eukprot:5270677-Prymnesium_polylepis.1
MQYLRNRQHVRLESGVAHVERPPSHVDVDAPADEEAFSCVAQLLDERGWSLDEFGARFDVLHELPTRHAPRTRQQLSPSVGGAPRTAHRPHAPCRVTTRHTMCRAPATSRVCHACRASHEARPGWHRARNDGTRRVLAVCGRARAPAKRPSRTRARA